MRPKTAGINICKVALATFMRFSLSVIFQSGFSNVPLKAKLHWLHVCDFSRERVF